jgi:hypothetical protein
LSGSTRIWRNWQLSFRPFAGCAWHRYIGKARLGGARHGWSMQARQAWQVPAWLGAARTRQCRHGEAGRGVARPEQGNAGVARRGLAGLGENKAGRARHGTARQGWNKARQAGRGLARRGPAGDGNAGLKGGARHRITRRGIHGLPILRDKNGGLQDRPRGARPDEARIALPNVQKAGLFVGEDSPMARTNDHKIALPVTYTAGN